MHLGLGVLSLFMSNRCTESTDRFLRCLSKVYIDVRNLEQIYITVKQMESMIKASILRWSPTGQMSNHSI